MKVLLRVMIVSAMCVATLLGQEKKTTQAPTLDETIAWLKAKFDQNAYRKMTTPPPDNVEPVMTLVGYVSTVPREVQGAQCEMSFTLKQTFFFDGNQDEWTTRYRLDLSKLDPGQVEVEEIEGTSYQRVLLRSYANRRVIRSQADQIITMKGQSPEQRKHDPIDTALVVMTLPSSSDLASRSAMAFRHAIKLCKGAEMKELFVDEEDVP